MLEVNSLESITETDKNPMNMAMVIISKVDYLKKLHNSRLILQVYIHGVLNSCISCDFFLSLHNTPYSLFKFFLLKSLRRLFQNWNTVLRLSLGGFS